MKKASSQFFLSAKVYRTMTSGRKEAPYFRRYGRELFSKPAFLLKKRWGGDRGTTLQAASATFIEACLSWICYRKGFGGSNAFVLS